MRVLRRGNLTKRKLRSQKMALIKVNARAALQLLHPEVNRVTVPGDRRYLLPHAQLQLFMYQPELQPLASYPCVRLDKPNRN
jgi:hypothetical protein